MIPQHDKKQQMLRYLLGQLPETEREDLEREFFESDDFSAELLAAEEKLMEEHASGIMDPSRKKQFEEAYISKPGVDELKLHRGLRALGGTSQRVQSDRSVAKTVAMTVLAACVALLAIGVFLIFGENRQLRTDMRMLQEQQQASIQKRSEPPRPQPTAPTSPQPPSADSIPTILLVAGLREAGGSAPHLVVTGSAAAYRLQAEVAGDAHSSYRARIESVEGRVLYEASPVKPSAAQKGLVSVEVLVPSNQLTTGDYILSLQSILPDGKGSDAGKFYFRLTRR